MKNEYDYLNDVKMDFTCYEEKNTSVKEINAMKKLENKRITKRPKKVFLIAACILVVTVSTAFATGFVDNIIKTISTGYNNYIQVDPNAPHEISDELKGKIFDENGVVLEALSPDDLDNIYDKDGNKITQEMFAKMIEEAFGGLVTYSGKYDAEKSEKNYSTLEEAQENTVFDIKTPEYLPEGYSISRIYTYKGDDGSSSGEYLTLVYKNGKGNEITIHERILNEDTAFEHGTDGSLEEITVNGQKGVIINGQSLSFETKDSVSVGIYTHGNISEDELIKMAESVK